MIRLLLGGTALGILLFASGAPAAPNVVNTTQKGSLVIFPEIDTSGERNTIIRLTNDNTQAINVMCYYGEFTDDPLVKPTLDFMFKLKKNQPAHWEAKDGNGTIPVPDFPNTTTGTGQLLCWAVTKGGGTQVKWNHLSGTATVIDTSDETAYTYNAYQSYARGVKNKQQVGTTPGTLELNGTAGDGAYDQCGRYVIGHFSPKAAVISLPGTARVGIVGNFLSVSSCTQDLSPVGLANPMPQTITFDVWNEDNLKVSGARESADSWWRMVLGNTAPNYSEIDMASDIFTFGQLQTNSAHFRAESEEGYGLLGVLVTDYEIFDSGAGATGVGNSNAAVTLNHAGKKSGSIQFRVGEDDPPEKN